MSDDLSVEMPPSEPSHRGGWCWLGSGELQVARPFVQSASVEVLLADLTAPVELCVIALPGKEQDAALKRLRQHEHTRFSFIVCTHESALSSALANGAWQGFPPPELEPYRQRLQQTVSSEQSSMVSQLCYYLWLFNTELQPVYEPQALSGYSYPLLECWNLEQVDCTALLKRWHDSELLEQARLVERIRVCAHCQSGHLNYSEVCPSCHGIDLRTEEALHCFRCGTVAEQSRFQRLGALRCPNCQNDLRHIGVDYDRPIENLRCHDCHQLFAEAPVVARCQSCQHENNTDALIQKSIRCYRLALRGRQLVRKGEAYLQQYWALSHHQQPQQLFFQQLAWLNDLAHRHAHQHQLLALNLPGFAQFRVDVGEVKALARLEALFERIRELLRNSDRYCQLGEDQLLILLPHTPNEDIRVIVERLLELERQQRGGALAFSLFTLSLPDSRLQDDVASWLYTHLEAVSEP